MRISRSRLAKAFKVNGLILGGIIIGLILNYSPSPKFGPVVFFNFPNLNAGESSNGIFQSYISNRFTSASPAGLDQKHAAFWGATRISPFGDQTFCASEISNPMVIMASVLDSPALNRAFGCPYVSNSLMVRGFSDINASYTLDGNAVPLIKQPTKAANPWKAVIDPNSDTIISTCDEFNSDNGGTALPGEQCFAVSWGADITALLTPGTHTGIFTLTSPDEECGANGDSEFTITIDPSC